MGIIEKKIYECDCCGKQSEKRDFNNGNECGSGRLSLTGSSGGLCYGGDWGGSNYDFKKLLCFSCAAKVIKHLKDLSEKSKQET